MDTDWTRLAYPRLCGLLAEHPSQLGAAMHNAGYRALELPFSYIAFKTRETAAAIEALRTLGIRGLSLTIPHKELGLRLMDEVSPEAKKIGAINTVVNSGKHVFGENTDWTGITAAIQEADVEILGKSVLVVGAGGAARAAVFAFQSLGAASIAVINRNVKRAIEVAASFGVDVLERSLPDAAVEKYDILANMTPVGSSHAPAHAPFLNFDRLHDGMAVFDAVTHDTPLLRHAANCGARTVSGYRMLLHQALRQFALFTEQQAPLDVLEAALRSAKIEQG